MKQKTLGIIGGLGPETGCKFCLSVNNKFKQLTNIQPHILLDNLPISQEAESRLINGETSLEHLDLLKQSVVRFNQINVDLVVIACNTVHTFIDELRNHSNISILSIIEETAKKCNELELAKVGILGSTKTIQSMMHTNELRKHNIETVIPNEVNQKFVSECIIGIINQKTREDDRARMLEIIQKLRRSGAEAVVLGCTDLPQLLSQLDVDVAIINTVEVMEDAVVKELMNT